MPEVWNPPPFDDISTSELVTAAYLNRLGNSLRFLKRVGHVEFNGDVNVSATAVGSANQIASLGAITYEAVPHLLVFFCPSLNSSTGQNYCILRDSTTVMGTLGRAAAGEPQGVYHAQRVFTPTAASHTFNVASWLTAAGTWQYKAGSGGTAGDDTSYLPGHISIYRIPT